MKMIWDSNVDPEIDPDIRND